MKRCPVCKTVYPDDANFCPMDAGRLIEEPAGAGAGGASLDLPTMQARVIGGRFRLGPLIGGHRTGEVYSAEDVTTGQPCALKLIAPAVFPTPLVAQRTERELKQLMKVSSERVARVLDVGKHGDRLYVAMELVGGVTLGELIAANGPLQVDQAVRLALEVGEALAEAAKLGVIHRDVAPKNVLIVGDDRAAGGRRVRLINFGIPTPVSDRVLGVPEFLSPEQAEGKPVDQRSNIYSLGTLLYTMLVGAPPFEGDASSVLSQQTSATPPPPSRRAHVPPELERLILKALEKASSRRHLTLRQLLGELEAALAHLPATVPAPLPYGGAASQSSEQRAAQQQPVAPMPAQAAAHRAHASATSKTMVGIGLKDILPHLEPPRAPPPAPPIMPKPPAVVVASESPGPGDAWATTQPGAPSSPQLYPHPYHSPQAPAYAEPPQPPQSLASPPPTPAYAPPQPSYPAYPTGAAPAPSQSAPSGKRARPAESGSGQKKGKFRETMWFKKGEIDEAAAAAAQAEGTVEPDIKIDDLPIEDRYKDDGTLTAADRERLSLRTGGTQMMPTVQAGQSVPGEKISDKEMLGELKSGNARLIALIVAALLVVGAVLVYFLVLRK